MESRHPTPSVIAKLMGLDEVPPLRPVREKHKVLSENYLQKVASIGVTKKRSIHEHHSFRNNKKKESENALKVDNTRLRDNQQNLSTRSKKANPDLSGTKVTHVGQKLSGTEHISVTGNPETLIESISSFNTEASVKSDRMSEQGNMQLLQTINKGLCIDMLGRNGLYGTLRFSKHLFESKDKSFSSKIVVLKPNPRRGKSGLKCFSLPSSSEISHLGDVQLNEFSCSKGTRVYPKIEKRQKLVHHMESAVRQQSRDFSKMSEEVSSQMGNAANSLEGKGVSEKWQAVGQCDQGLPPHQLVNIPEHGYRARNLVHKPFKHGYQSCFNNAEAKSASVSTVNPRIGTKDEILHKHWGFRLGISSNWSPMKSKKQNVDQKDRLEHMNLSSSRKKSQSLFTYFGSNHNEEKCIGLHKLKKFYGNDLLDQKPMITSLSMSGNSTFRDSHEVKSNNLEDSYMSNQHTASPNLSNDCLADDPMREDVSWPCGNPKELQSELLACNLFEASNDDSSSHTSYVSMEEETLESHEEDSVYSLCSGTEEDSLGSFEKAYETSPISVLEPPFREDISSSSECLMDVGDGIYDSSEMDNEGFDLNISSDEDCGDRSVVDLEEKQDLAEFFRAEESRDFSYVVEVLTEACISSGSLYTDFCTWHSPECPISPCVFEILEKKFGEQPYWKRSDRRLLFDRINLGLMEILQPHVCIPKWEKPVSRRLNAEPSQDMIEEELWGLLVVQEKEARKESTDKMLGGEIRWIDIGDDVEVIVGEIVKLLIDELVEEIVTWESI